LCEIDLRWQRLRIGEEENEDGFSVMDEWIGIQEHIKKAPYKMKLHTMEIIRQLAFSEATMFSPPQRNVQTKRPKKRVRSTPKVASTSRISSMWKCVDS